ncbi:MAG: Smr/MutS family protein [Acidobacteriales bacterium]|nr:Smr/MutS family protein [Terriglobales bacterium]
MPKAPQSVNLEEGLPSREQAYAKLDAALEQARKNGVRVLKVIHGYGSTGKGGVLRFAVRGYLRRRKDKREIAIFVSGEDWSKFEERSRELLARAPELASDQDLGRKNKGITLVLL